MSITNGYKSKILPLLLGISCWVSHRAIQANILVPKRRVVRRTILNHNGKSCECRTCSVGGKGSWIDLNGNGKKDKGEDFNGLDT